MGHVLLQVLCQADILAATKQVSHLGKHRDSGKDGPGGKYRQRVVTTRKSRISAATRMKKKKEKEEQKSLTVEDIQNDLEETKTALRLAQQLAASRPSDIQFLKSENTKINIRAKKLNEEVEDLHDTARGAKRKCRQR